MTRTYGFRDAQRTRLYGAESALRQSLRKGGPNASSRGDVQVTPGDVRAAQVAVDDLYAEAVEGDYITQRPKAAPTVIAEPVEHKRWVAFYKPGDNTIHLGPTKEAWTGLVISHETAHAFTSIRLPNHGPHFAATQLALSASLCGEKVAADLERRYLTDGVLHTATSATEQAFKYARKVFGEANAVGDIPTLQVVARRAKAPKTAKDLVTAYEGDLLDVTGGAIVLRDTVVARADVLAVRQIDRWYRP